MNALEAIRTKRAVRNFEDKPLSKESVIAILNAGRLSQSAKNMQPWQFIAIQDKSILKALSKHGQYTNHLAGAALGKSPSGLIDRRVRLQNRLELEELEHLEHIAHHASQLEVAGVVSDFFDFADEDTPARGTHVGDTRQVDDDFVAALAQQVVERRLKFTSRGRIKVTAYLQDRYALCGFC